MKRSLIRRFLVLLLLCCLLLPTLGCGEGETVWGRDSFLWFDTVTTLTGYGEAEEFERVWTTVCEELTAYHRLYDIYQPYEGLHNLYTVNELWEGVHREVQVDPRIMDLLRYGREIWERTEGRVNVAMGSLLSLWREYRQQGLADPASARLPSKEELEEAAAHADIEKMVLNEERRTVYLADPQMRLDVGAIAKGYATEMVARRLEQEGYEGYLLNVGGNVRAIGGRREGEPFSVGIENPFDTEGDGYLAVLSLKSRALVTSGSYQRYYTVDGRRYHHIVDPDTRMPAEGYRSVSVLCPSSAEADALSTAMFLLSVEEGRALLSHFPEAEALWVLEDGEIVASDGFESHQKKQ